MAKKRTLCPFYTKRMQHMTASARRTGALGLQMHVSGAIHDLLMRVAVDHWRDHRFASDLRTSAHRKSYRRSGLNYAPAIAHIERKYGEGALFSGIYPGTYRANA